jgi:hypothetical protein
MTPDQLAGEARILVIALRRLGDVLLTTPLIRSIKRAFPAASIDALVFAGTRGILAGQSRSRRHHRRSSASERARHLGHDQAPGPALRSGAYGQRRGLILPLLEHRLGVARAAKAR